MGYGNPFAPKSYRERAPERAPDLPPILRLRRAGLTDADEPIVQARWAAMTNDERLEAAAAMEYVDNDELRRQIEEMRDEAAAGEALGEYDEPDPEPPVAPDPVKPKRRARKAARG